MNDQNHIDMCHGPLFMKVVKFSVPLICSGMLQLLFNAADLIVIGKFGSKTSLAAVGETIFLVNLILNIFVGLSIGINVLAANYYGARDRRDTSRTTHTAIAFSLLGGIVLAALSALATKPLLVITATPEDVLRPACIYLWIFSCGIPFIILFNFGSAVLRAVGDTRRPMNYLIFAGIINVLLNLLFVIVFHWDVAGVAAATIISQGIAAILVVRNLMNTKDMCRLRPSLIRIDPKIFKNMLWIGLPAGLQGAFFSISNLVIQTSLNELGTEYGVEVVAGNTAALSIECVVYQVCLTYHQTIISFAGQNFGGKKYIRILRSILHCTICSVIISSLLGVLCWYFGPFLLSIYNSDPKVIEWGMIRVKILLLTYGTCATMDIVSGALRGLGHSIGPAVVTMMGVCVLRVLWVFFIFPLDRTMDNLMASYPVSWIVTTLANGIYLYFVCRKFPIFQRKKDHLLQPAA